MAEGDGAPHRFEGAGEELAQGVRRRDADEGHRLGFGDALQKGFAPPAGVNQHRHGSHFGQGKGDGNHLHAQRPHHQGAVARLKPGLAEAVGVSVDQLVELLKAELDKSGPVGGVPPGGKNNGPLMGPLGGHLIEGLGKVVGFGEGKRGVGHRRALKSSKSSINFCQMSLGCQISFIGKRACSSGRPRACFW